MEDIKDGKYHGKTDFFDEPVMVEFEGHQFRAPKNWDRYLKNQYGDYMKLPPEEDRKVHDFHAEWKSADHD